MSEILSQKISNVSPRPSTGRIAAGRLALASGIIFSLVQLGALFYFIIFIFPRMGPPEATAQHLLFYTQHGEALRFGNYLLMLPAPFFLLFLGGLFGLLRQAEGDQGPLAPAALTGGVLVAILWPLSGVLNNIGIDIAQAGGNAATIVALDAIGPYMLALSALPRVVLLAATSGGLLSARLIPRWLGWLGLGLALVSLAGSATLVAPQLFPVLALGTLLFEVWVLLLSMALLRRR